MAKISSVYHSRFVQPFELSYYDRRYAVIERVTLEVFGIDFTEKLVVTLNDRKGWGKDLTLNQTNARRLAAAFGDDTDDWAEKPVELWIIDVEYQGKTVMSVQIGPPPPPALTAPTPSTQTPKPTPTTASSRSLRKDLDDDIPF